MVGIRSYFLLMIKKDYLIWHGVKTQLNNESKPSSPYFYEKEIWWTSIGQNIRCEEDGKGERFLRPVLILRKFNQSFYLGVPLSTTKKRGMYYYAFIYKIILEVYRCYLNFVLLMPNAYYKRPGRFAMRIIRLFRVLSQKLSTNLHKNKITLACARVSPKAICELIVGVQKHFVNSVVRPEGLEPPAFSSEARRSIR